MINGLFARFKIKNGKETKTGGPGTGGLAKKKFLPLFSMGAVLALLMTAGGFGFAASREQNDSFCASCHTNPESIYYERSIAVQSVDLASAHTREGTRCIDCHSGVGILGRITAELMGAQNAFLWYSGMATQPAPLTHAITDEHCVKCHTEVTSEEHDAAARTRFFGPKGHYHARLTRWKEMDQAVGDCVACHAGHNQGGEDKTTWIATASVKQVCDACHDVMGTD